MKEHLAQLDGSSSGHFIHYLASLIELESGQSPDSVPRGHLVVPLLSNVEFGELDGLEDWWKLFVVREHKLAWPAGISVKVHDDESRWPFTFEEFIKVAGI